MKLHVGCGKFYKPDYVNIDFYDRSVSDTVMLADELGFPSNSADVIEAHQTIEHFDCVKVPYVFSEWFRVLKPMGTLIVETPDLETTFREYLDAKITQRKTMINWIFGTDSPGMRHKCCFSFDVLNEMLTRVGFVKVRREEQKTHTYACGMRIVCTKPWHKFEKYQILALLRNTLKKEIAGFIDTTELLMDFEKNCTEKLASFLLGRFEKRKKKTLDQMQAEVSPYCPTAVRTFLEIVNDAKTIDRIDTHIETARYLERIRFPGKLFSVWQKMRKPVGQEIEMFTRLLVLAGLSVKKLLTSPSSNEIREKLEKIKGKDMKYFSLHVIRSESDKLFRVAVKNFANNQLQDAKKLLHKSVKLTPDNFLLHWNLARILAIEEKDGEAEEAYTRVFNLIKGSRFQKVLLREMQSLKRKRLYEKLPIDEQALGI
ncbi:MAG: methyltransferase domain-containing protein [Candidatus Bathyarchaeota archaeon]|nr:MAG: methyltransferase domain-containing protein [Candidatus Bathyarchaeota archaeon]